jgi:hypothetical protein
MRNNVFLGLLLLAIGCASTKQPEIVTFSPLSVNRVLLEKKDFSEVISIVNKQYDGGKHAFTTVDIMREEAIYLTLKLTSNNSADGCCKVSVDKNRSAIVSMQPDCPIEVED